jgi:hypothetical protein
MNTQATKSSGIPIYHVQVRRDPHTTTPTHVPEHEIAVLQTIFGEENIQNLHGKPIGGDEGAGLPEPIGELRNGEDEFSRLSAKYGADDKGNLWVQQVFGTKASRGLENAIEHARRNYTPPATQETGEDEAEEVGASADQQASAEKANRRAGSKK